METYEDRLIELGKTHPNGFSDWDIHQAFPHLQLAQIVNIINHLLETNKLQIFRQGDRLIYRIVTDRTETDGLSGEEKIVYQHIKASGARGIWVKDLKLKTSLHHLVVSKILKSLETRKIIKAVKSIKNSTKKVYMLYGIEPSTDVTGGPWFSDNELDEEFINGILDAIHRFVLGKSIPPDPTAIFPHNYGGYMSLDQIYRFISTSGISNVELSMDDVLTVTDILVYDERLDKIENPKAPSNPFYKATKSSVTGSFTSIPCGTCPVIQACSDKGVINPLKCVYLTRWLEY